MPLIYLSAAFLSGVFIASLWHVSSSLELPGLALGLIGLVISRWLPGIRLLALSVIVLIGGVWRYDMAATASENGFTLEGPTALPAEIRGLVDAPPEMREMSQSIRLTVKEIRRNDRWEDSQGVLLIYASMAPVFEYGDYLEASGELVEPTEFGGFDYREYLSRQGIRYLMERPRIKLLDHSRGFLLTRWLYGLRARLSDILGMTLPEPEASVAQGVLVGVRSSMPRDLVSSFATTATTHILAISGYNITVIAAMLVVVATRIIGRNKAAYVATVGILFYAFLAGASPSVLRATVMGVFAIMAYRIGRQSYIVNALAISAAALVAIQPEWLWDVGFQLSFLATAGLVFVSRPLTGFLNGMAGRVWLIANPIAEKIADFVIEGLSITAAATIYTLPIIALDFHSVSLISPLANILAVPVLPLIIAGTAAVSLLGLVSLPLAQLAAYLTWPFLAYLIGVVNLFASFPYASISVPSIDPIYGWIYYSILAALTFALHLGRDGLLDARARMREGLQEISGAAARIGFALPGGWTIPPTLLVAVVAWAVVFLLPDDKLHVTFLDVGQGDAILVKTPDNRKILVDGGPSQHRLLNQLGEHMPFWERTIDVVILTHPDEDHLAGLLGVLDRYEVKLVAEAPLSRSTPTYQSWQEEISRRGIRRMVFQAGQQLRLGEVRVDVISVPEAPVTNAVGRSNDSLVLNLKMRDTSLLLPGDTTAESQAHLLSRGEELKGIVLKVPHHGARDSLNESFFDAVSPQVAVISVGADNSLGHPAPETLALLSNTFTLRTDEKGAIEVVTDGRKLWVKTRR